MTRTLAALLALILATPLAHAQPPAPMGAVRQAAPPSPAEAIAAFEAAVSRDVIAVDFIERDTPDGPIRGFVARINLAAPGIDIAVTDPLDTPPADNVEGILEPTDAWAKRVNATLAVNANFFSWLNRDEGWTDLIGLSASDGQIVSPRRTYQGVADAALVFDDQGQARIVPAGQPIDAVYDAVSGVGASDSVPTRNGLLVTAGENTAMTTRVAPEVRHPRTAAGVTDDGKALILMVIDGRQPDWSIGIDLVDLADLMIEYGSHTALNLDGGGSSAFVLRHPDTGELIAQNRPSDGDFRAVANSIGVRLLDTPEPR
ncbi:MAG: phosphodiester glycosidase family protein [Planctomycetota bacterium]